MTDNHSKRALQGRRVSHDSRASFSARRALNGLFALALLSPAAAFAKPPADSQSALIAHGNYIVHRVGMCIDCHTPKDAHGMPIAIEDLLGADSEPDNPIPGWTNRSVKIAGLPAGYTEAQLATFLDTGHTQAAGPRIRRCPSTG
jgi:mono/diheme cytochrome c family protein